MKHLFLVGGAFAALTLTSTAYAQHEGHDHHDHAAHRGIQASNHDGHVHLDNVPASIMGDHVHGKGEWMFSYRYMRMDMGGNRDGTNDLSPTDISGDFPNVTGVGPATLRIVPTEMTMDMHMLGAMYGLTDRITLMAMANYIKKDMDHLTFAGMNPDLLLGEFNTRASGWGDTKLGGLFDVYNQHQSNTHHNIVAAAMLSLPTGSIKETDDILNPMNARQTVRLPYAMQLGSGTYDLEPALTYTGTQDVWNWGAQYRGVIRTGENSQDYTLGDKHRVSVWGGYRWNENIETNLRVSGEHEGDIRGRDTSIAGPVQTANPDNYGGRHMDIGLGLNLHGSEGVLKNHGISFEATLPIYQDLNGPQMERDYGLTAAYKVSF